MGEHEGIGAGWGERGSPPPSQERSRGAFLGLAVGDALGTTHEFLELPAPPFPILARGPLTDVVGGGPFRLVPGQVTDDTHMACCLAASLRAHGRLDPADVAARYVRWQDHAFDIGNQTAAALNAIREGTPPHEAGRQIWTLASRPPAGNGSLMRTGVVGVLLAGDPALRRRAALDDSAITHYDPRCRLACATFDAAVAAALTGPLDARALLAAARAELPAAAALLLAEGGAGAAHVPASVRDLEEDLSFAEKSDPRLYGREVHLHRNQGFVRVAFRLAFWEALHAPTWEAALLDVVNRGGDADTNGAITGALLGALHGEEAIPRAWRERVLGAVPGKEGPLRDLYHPSALLAALGPSGV